MKKIELIKKIKHFFSQYGSLLLSHHPDCDEYKNHVFKIGKKRFCIGCFIGFPSMFLTILIIFFLGIPNYISHSYLFLIGLILLSSYLLKLIPFMKSVRGRICIRSLFGIGLGFLFWGIFASPLSLAENLIVFIFIFGSFYTFYSTSRVISIHITCHKCKHEHDWKKCPGFKSIRNHEFKIKKEDK
ncbi:MAG: hypothetical protein ACTSVY_02830 [Candidatus Helarchaeota archaeon]